MLFGDDNDDDEAKQSNMREVSEREWSDRVLIVGVNWKELKRLT